MSKITIDAAEKLAGRRLDRRFNYYLYNGQLCTYGTWTESCSGCFEGGEYNGLIHHYPFDKKRQCYIGFGCDECGYTGKRIDGWFEPISECGTVFPKSSVGALNTPPTDVEDVCAWADKVISDISKATDKEAAIASSIAVAMHRCGYTAPTEEPR